MCSVQYTDIVLKFEGNTTYVALHHKTSRKSFFDFFKMMAPFDRVHNVLQNSAKIIQIS